MSDAVEQAASTPPKMLIADDDPSVLNLLAERCAKMGFDVDTAANGMQLLIKARQRLPDILIVDVNMPELDGLAVCSRLLGPDNKPIEVIVVTGRSDAETIERCGSFGAFYGRKGPNFWSDINAKLCEIYPHMADRIAQQTTRPTGSKVRERPRVLIVDDDPGMQALLASRLAKCGVDTLYAADATQGHRIACKERPSVVIVDYLMPNGDARYLIGKLRTTKATMNIPVFVMSEHPLDETTKRDLLRDIGGRPGAAQIFMKSLAPDELFGALQKYCSFDNPPSKPRPASPAAPSSRPH